MFCLYLFTRLYYMFLDLSGLINGGPVHGREYIHNPVASLFSFCLLLTRMGLDHFNDFKSTTELPAGFSVDQDNQFSSITLVAASFVPRL